MAKVTKDEYSAVDQDNYLPRSFLDLEKIDENLFRSKTLWKHKLARGIFGGHMIGQALVAASQGVPDNQHVHSLHSYFLKQGKEGTPVLYHVDKTRDGRTYCARSVKAVQSGMVILTMQASFKQVESFSLVHQLPMPKVPHPEQLESITEALDRFYKEKRVSEMHYRFGTEWYSKFPAITKLVEPDQLLLQEAYYPKRHLWIKARDPIGDEEHQNVHKCCLAYFSDSFLLQTALLCMAPFSDTSSIFQTSLDHSMWFHAPCRADEWLLYQLETEHIGDGRALCRGSMWDTNGNLVITVAQEGVTRHNKGPSKL